MDHAAGLGEAVSCVSEAKRPCPECSAEMEQKLADVVFAKRLVGHPVVEFREVPAEVCPQCGCQIVDGPLMIELERLADAYLEAEDESALRKLAPGKIEVHLAASA